MLNFAEQTGSGAVMLVWSFSQIIKNFKYNLHTDIRRILLLVLATYFFK